MHQVRWVLVVRAIFYAGCLRYFHRCLLTAFAMLVALAVAAALPVLAALAALQVPAVRAVLAPLVALPALTIAITSAMF